MTDSETAAEHMQCDNLDLLVRGHEFRIQKNLSQRPE